MENIGEVDVNILEDSQFLICNTEEQLLQLLEDTPCLSTSESALLNSSSLGLLPENSSSGEVACETKIEDYAQQNLMTAQQPTFFVAGHLDGNTLYLLEQPQTINNLSSEGSSSESSYDSPGIFGENCDSSPLSEGSPQHCFGFSSVNQKKRGISELDGGYCEAKEFQFDEPLDIEALKTLSSQEIENYTKAMAASKKISPEEVKELKRQRRLLKNREYAQQSRRKKKTYVSELEQKVQALEEENKKLKSRVDKLTLEVKRSKGITHLTNPAIPVILQANPSTLLPSSCSVSFIQADHMKKEALHGVKTGLSNKVRVVGTCLMILLFSFGFLFESPFMHSSQLQTNVYHTGRILFAEGSEEFWFGVIPVCNFLGERNIWLYQLVCSYSVTDPLEPEVTFSYEQHCLDCDKTTSMRDSNQYDLERYHNSQHHANFNVTEYVYFW
eukprot:TRINITY_DN4094_c0_g1_i1.p1 TRINITY_DN4094_c0_g1~~TRINITY_DN4094_c0_g1_i1.p1  ORF type:complete len:455 (+),score=87.16 TRINITY_DN4094_c0_g1_i1:37-1365(+)